jgi:pantothenate kinase
LPLQGLNEQVAMGEVVEVYLPLARLLNLYVKAEQVLTGPGPRSSATRLPRYQGSDRLRGAYWIRKV